MKANERRVIVLNEIYNGNGLTREIASKLMMSIATVLTDRNKLKKDGLIETQGKSVSMQTQLTKKGLESIGKDPKEYKKFGKEKPKHIKTKNDVKKKHRRVGVLAYLTFKKKFRTIDIAKMLGVSPETITTDLREMKKSGLLIKNAGLYSLTAEGILTIDGYDNNYGLGRLKVTT